LTEECYNPSVTRRRMVIRDQMVELWETVRAGYTSEWKCFEGTVCSKAQDFVMGYAKFIEKIGKVTGMDVLYTM
jgi:hypothetical protein